MILHVHILLILSIVFISCVSSEDIVIETKNGNLRGTTITSPRGNKTFLAFMGIPYARPPVGNLRFKDPQPAENWSGVRNATKEGSVCPQIHSWKGKVIGNEDCLVLNVFTLEMKSDSPKPVMVWIHGGSFLTQSGNMEYAGPNYLVEEDIVFVSINYRLGSLGFLCLENADVPGNAGLKDQVLALKWVQENIKNFGGDPNKVTIAGESAGSLSVELHRLSPMSKGLFHQSISESGTALSMWTFHKPNSSLPFLFGEILQVVTQNKTELLKKLRTLPAKELVEATEKLREMMIVTLKPGFGIVLDKDFSHGEVFLPDESINLLNSGKFNKVPSIIGMNSAEGISFLSIVVNFLDKTEEFIKMALGDYFKNEVDSSTYMEIIERINDFYFKNTTYNENILQGYVNFTTDVAFLFGTYCTARKVTAHSELPTYLYEFSYVGEMNLYKKIFGGWDMTGAAHVDEQAYIYSRLPDEFKKGSQDLLASKRMVRMWGNFVKTGNPTPMEDPLLQNITWSPINKMVKGYLNIDDNLIYIHRVIKETSIDFWTQLYQNYGKHTLCWKVKNGVGGIFSNPTSWIIAIFLLHFLIDSWI